nr:hypothetical protein Itr_chr12CG12140 [Ipomoea trifida]
MSTRKTGEEHRIHGLAEDCNRGDCETEGDDESSQFQRHVYQALTLTPTTHAKAIFTEFYDYRIFKTPKDYVAANLQEPRCRSVEFRGQAPLDLDLREEGGKDKVTEGDEEV